MNDLLAQTILAVENGQISSLDLLNQVDTFYNSAWNKLLIFGSIIFGVGTIVVPMVVQWYQKKTLQLREDILKKEIELGIKKAKEDLSAELAKLIDLQAQEHESKIDELRAETHAKLFHIQGTFHLQRRKLEDALRDFIVAARDYRKCRDFENLQTVLKVIDEVCLPWLSLEDIEELPSEKNADLNKLLSDLEQGDEQNILSSRIRGIRRRLKKIPKAKKDRREPPSPSHEEPQGQPQEQERTE